MSVVGYNTSTPVSSRETGTAFGLGDRFTSHDGKEYVYVQASGAITGEGYVVTVDEDYQAAMLSTSNDAGGDLVAVAPAAFADDDYGWVQVKGKADIRVAASAAANTALNTTGTAGQLDDDGAVGSFDIDGLVLTTANGASAGTAEGVLNYPQIAMAAN